MPDERRLDTFEGRVAREKVLKAEDPKEPHGLAFPLALLEAVIELEHRVREIEASLDERRESK